MTRFKILVKYQKDTGKTEFEIRDEEKIPRDLVPWGWDHFDQLPIYATKNVPQPQDKFDKHLNHIRKTKFESRLAFDILNHNTLFLPLLRKIGQMMKDYLLANVPEDKEVRAGEMFKSYFFSDRGILGSIGPTKSARIIDSRMWYMIALDALTSSKSIPAYMNLFLAFWAVCFFELGFKNNADYLKILAHVGPEDLFGNRGRNQHRDKIIIVRQAGIEADITTTDMPLSPHKRSVDNVSRDMVNSSDFVLDALRREIPFIAGLSGTVRDAIMAVMILGLQHMNSGLSLIRNVGLVKQSITTEEWREYIFCLVGFETGSGNHSMHEIYAVANRIGVPYDIGRYEAVIPEAYKNITAYDTITQQFPDIIRKHNNILEINGILRRSSRDEITTHLDEEKHRLSSSSSTATTASTTPVTGEIETPVQQTPDEEIPEELEELYEDDFIVEIEEEEGLKQSLRESNERAKSMIADHKQEQSLAKSKSVAAETPNSFVKNATRPGLFRPAPILTRVGGGFKPPKTAPKNHEPNKKLKRTG